MKKGMKIAALFLVFIILSGCTSKYTQLHKLLIIREIGIDRTETGYKLSVCVFKVTDDTDSMEIFEVEGESIFVAIKELTELTGKEAYCGHNQGIVIGAAAAKEGISDMLEFFVRYYECRPDVNLFLTEGTASETIKNTKDTRLLEEAADASLIGGSNGRFSQTTVLEVTKALLTEGIDPYMPLLQKNSDENYVLAGTALFSGDKYVGRLDEEETKGFLLLLGSTKGAVIHTAAEKQRVVFELGNTSVKIKPVQTGKSLSFFIDTDISAKVYEKIAGKALAEEEFQKILETAAVKSIRSVIGKTLLCGCDPVGFRRIFERKYPGEEGEPLAAQYEISVRATITSFGQLQGKGTQGTIVP